MNPFFKYESQRVPCRYFAQGTCWNGDSCPYFHQLCYDHPITSSLTHFPVSTLSTAPTTTLCRFFHSPEGCRNGDHCPFQHGRSSPTSLPNAPTCSCVKENKHNQYKHISAVQKKNSKKKKKKQLLCVISNRLGNQILEHFPLMELTSWQTMPSNLWYFYNAKNRSTLKLRYQADQFYLEGEKDHHYCVLYWLESLFSSLFCVSVEVVKGFAVMMYCDNRVGELYVVPFALSHRFNELHRDQQALALTQSTPISTKEKGKVKRQTKPFSCSPLDVDEKLAILDYARQLAEQESESEEMEEVDSIEEEEEIFSGELDDDCSIFHHVEPTHVQEIDCNNGYCLKHHSSFVDDVCKWLLDNQRSKEVVFYCHSFISQGGWHVLSLSEESKRMLDEASAGCGQACQLSEAISFSVLQSVCPAVKLVSTEMEIDYWKVNSPKLDYLCVCGSSKIGVSVTRAWNGPYKPFSTLNARRLLQKKLKGLNRALECVSSAHFWDQQILHIWTPSEKVSLLLTKELQFMDELLREMIKPTLIIITNAQFEIAPEHSFLFRCN